MKKILGLVVIVGLFYGCSSKVNEEPKSTLELLQKSYNEGEKKIIIPEMGTLNLKDFFSLSKEEQNKKLYEIEKAKQSYFAKRGIFYNLNDSDEEKNKKATEQSLTNIINIMPTLVKEKMQKARAISLNKDIQKIILLIKKEDIAGVKQVLEKGFDINQIINNHMQHTIIFNAIKTGNINLVNTIVEHGAKLNIEDLNGDTPIVYAAKLEKKNIVKYLLEQNIDFSIETSLLQEILVFNDFKLIDKCLTKGLKINGKNSAGNTPLILAVDDRANLEIIKYLISKGANIYDLSEKGQNILEVAQINNRQNIYNYLKTIYKSQKNSHIINDKQNKILERIYQYHNTLAINKIAISKDEKQLVSVDYTGIIRVFNLTNGELLKTFHGENKNIIFLKFINNDNQIITSSSNLIEIWNIHNGKLVKSLSEQSIEGEIQSNKSIEQVKKTPMYQHANNQNRNRLELITKMANEVLGKAIQKQLNIQDKKNIHIYSIDIIPNEQFLIVSKTNGNINIWDIQKGKIIKVIENKEAMSLVVFDNKNIVYSNKDNVINFLNLDTEKTIEITDNKSYRTEKIYKKGKYLFIDNSSVYLRVINMETKKEEIGFIVNYPINTIEFDNTNVIIGTSKGRVYSGDLLSTPNKNEIVHHNLVTLGFHNSDIKDLIILPKSKEILSVGTDGFKLWKI